MVSLGVDSQYRIERMRKLILRPEFTGEAYRWTMKDSGGADSTVSTEREFIFVAEKPGTYALRLDIIDAQNPVMQEVEINVDEESVAYSRYITEVYEYRPAPGQFVNIMPLYEEGDTEEDMCRKARESISGTNDIMISLGGYGGYVTFGFDHTVVNVPGQKDFKILGNAFYADANPNPSAPDSGGSCEPGIVMVSIDQNNNGLPDDEWYELAGSEYHKPETRHGFQITYTRPAADKMPTPDDNSPITDTTYILGKPETAKRAILRKTLTTTRTTILRGLPKTGCSSAGRVWPTTPWTKAVEKALTLSFTPTNGATWTTTLTAKRTKSVSTSVGRWTAWGIPSTCPVWTSSAYIPVSTNNAVGWGRLPPN